MGRGVQGKLVRWTSKSVALSTWRMSYASEAFFVAAGLGFRV